MVKDPVCGMQVDERHAVATTNYKGRPYYFCSTSCKAQFDKGPEQFVKPQ